MVVVVLLVVVMVMFDYGDSNSLSAKPFLFIPNPEVGHEPITCLSLQSHIDPPVWTN